MISLRKPSIKAARAFLASQAGLAFTYTTIGATATLPPSGYNVDYIRVRLGEGEGVFAAAKAALERWEQFNLGWVQAWPQDDSIQEGRLVAVVGRSLGLWWWNACRVVYVVDEHDEITAKFGFAYGTLPEHAESGEERFLIEWNRKDGGVWFDILAFSRPQKFLARFGYCWVRRLQKRFGRDSVKAMVNAVDTGQSGETGQSNGLAKLV